MRIILHIDLDAFYASVEERDRPELKGKPIVVGADPKRGFGRGVVSTCNYEARKFGVRSGMPISIAYRKCPNCIFLPVDMEKYVEVSNKIMTLFKSYADAFEQGSIDECYLDVSNRCKNFTEAMVLAKEIKQKLLKQEKLTCSIGIGPNKLVAKIAAGMEKPDGLTIVRPDYVLEFLAPLPVDKLPGVGPKTNAKLNELGIYKVADLRKISRELLVSWFGKFGSVLYDEARGIDDSPLIESWEAKSIGRQITFEKDTKDKKLIFATLDEMIADTIKQLKTEKLMFKTITIKVRYEDFYTTSKAKTLKEATNDAEIAKVVAKELITPFLEDSRKVRLIGFSVSKLS